MVFPMSEITVRILDAEDWQDYRTARLAALRESPEAFVATVAEEEGYEDDVWRERMKRSERLVALRGGDTVGVVSVGQGESEDGNVGEIFGLWVAPQARGTGVATALVKRGAELVRERGQTHVVYWVGTENGRAVAFASGMGFRPTDSRRPMGVVSEEDGDQEIAMLLSVVQDPGPQPRF